MKLVKYDGIWYNLDQIVSIEARAEYHDSEEPYLYILTFSNQKELYIDRSLFYKDFEDYLFPHIPSPKLEDIFR